MKNPKFLSVMSTALLVIALAMSFFLLRPVTAEAATITKSGTCGYNLTYTLDDEGTLTISGTGSMRDWDNCYAYAPWYNYLSSVKNVVIDNGVTSIGEYAFYNCYNLKSVTIPDSVTSIGSEAFDSCTSLTSVTIPDSVTTIGWGAFYRCDALTSVTIPDSVTSIGNYAFYYCKALTSVTIGNGVKSIGVYAFYSCDSLKSVTIPDSVTSIYSYAFYWCDALTSVTIPDSVTSIGNQAFYYCTRLTSVTIGDSVKSIGNDAFEGCSRITDVYITNPSSWCNIDFGNEDANPLCNGGNLLHILDLNGNEITDITLDSTVTTVPAYAFYGSAITSVTIPNTVAAIGDSAFRYCSSLTGIWVDEDNAAYSSDSYGILFNKDKTLLIQAPANGISGSYTIPDSVESIGEYAFHNCDALTSVTIPDSITSIGGRAFYDCDALKSVTIGDGVTSIGEFAFEDCNALTSVTIGNSVTGISVRAFYECRALKSVTIPDSVQSIGNYAFEWCYNLTDVYYAGSQSQWDAISIGSNNYSLTSATIHYNHVHDYTLLPATTVAPTCTEDGYTEYTCVWGETYREVLLALGHSTGSDAVITPPTCTEKGYTTSTCPRCNKTVTTDRVATLGHDYSGAVTTVEPTCTEQGYTGSTCTRCGDVEKTNPVDTLGHKMALVPASDPTCEKPGLSVGTACQYCGLVGVAQKETAPALGGNCDFTAGPTTCSLCGYVRADVVITNVVLRPSCSGLYFKGGFTFGAHETAIRYGIAVSLYNQLPVADDSDATSLYTVGQNSVLISDILGEGKNGRDIIYARAYALLEDGTYIYGDVVATNLKTVVETICGKWDSLTEVQKTAITEMYRQHTAVMQDWLIPKIKELV